MTTLHKSIDVMVASVPHAQRLAYAWGFCHGWRGARFGATGPAIGIDTGSAGYEQGYNHGTRCRNGQESLPIWARPVN